MTTFSDMINFKYDEQDVDKDIRHLLKTGEFKPAYEDAVREFLSSEIQNCKQSINDENFHLNVFNQGSMSEDALKKTQLFCKSETWTTKSSSSVGFN